ncbi:unnamed protein product [Ceutorhynchus assimilis]|uniref:Uncharacterized protein n=1 Tax=Ceutorhynchus assimilis TaxID=467358 RepID=A0A9N9QS83_9CUCU|nr:unnamed protein product [Ceutorhynchus assimilis]
MLTSNLTNSKNRKTLNNVAAFNFATLKLCDLEQNKPYRVQQIQALQTVHGRRVIVDLPEIQKIVFLPERFKCLTNEEIDSLNKQKSIHLVYKGKKTLTSGKVANDLEFLELE